MSASHHLETCLPAPITEIHECLVESTSTKKKIVEEKNGKKRKNAFGGTKLTEKQKVFFPYIPLTSLIILAGMNPVVASVLLFFLFPAIV